MSSFYSQSAKSDQRKRDDRAPKLINIRPYSKPTIIWIGSADDELFSFGARLGFSNVVYTGTDLSILLHAKAIVVENCEVSAAIVGFAKNYNIPLIWYSQSEVPIQWARSFSPISRRGDSRCFYGKLCEIIM